VRGLREETGGGVSASQPTTGWTAASVGSREERAHGFSVASRAVLCVDAGFDLEYMEMYGYCII